MKPKNFTFTISLGIQLFIFFLVSTFFITQAYAQNWSAPSGAPPAGNTERPLNVGSSLQYKAGPLQVLQFRSNQYCDAAGNNCFRPGTATGQQITCQAVGWQDLEIPGPGNQRGMIHPGSVSRRCADLGYNFGFSAQIFDETAVDDRHRWCRFGNARTALWGNTGGNSGTWRIVSCIPYQNTSVATCCRVTN